MPFSKLKGRAQYTTYIVDNLLNKFTSKPFASFYATVYYCYRAKVIANTDPTKVFMVRSHGQTKLLFLCLNT